MYYYSPKNDSNKYECSIINDNVSKKKYVEVNDGLLEYVIKMIKIAYNKGENIIELDVLPEEIEYKSKI